MLVFGYAHIGSMAGFFMIGRVDVLNLLNRTEHNFIGKYTSQVTHRWRNCFSHAMVVPVIYSTIFQNKQ